MYLAIGVVVVTVPLGACAAARLSILLTDAELLVLMASQGIAKRGPVHRVFSERNLAKPSVTKALEVAGVHLGDCLDELVRKGMLARRGRGAFAATSAGNTVKHAFNDLSRSVRMAPGGPGYGVRTLDLITLLRREMRSRCDEAKRIGCP